MFSFQAQAKNPPPGTGTADIPANILIMLDNSGSMGAKLYNSVQVYYPLDVATDSSGNVYVMEYYMMLVGQMGIIMTDKIHG